VVLYQRPNARITLVGTLRGTGTALRVLGVTQVGSPLDVGLERAATVVFLWWSLDELLRGASPYRRTIGAVCLATGVARAVRAERRRSAAGRASA
jgi:hypothetical protein